MVATVRNAVCHCRIDSAEQGLYSKTYPFLVDTKETFKDLSKDYPEIIINIKTTFRPKISSYVLFQTESTDYLRFIKSVLGHSLW